MTEFVAVTDEHLARARREPEFRRKLLSDNLDLLLAALNRMRGSSKAAADPATARQIRDGVELAVKLADLLQAPQNGPSRAA